MSFADKKHYAAPTLKSGRRADESSSFHSIGAVSERKRKAVVIGAGLGGLSAAIHLQQDGWDVTILERNGRVGGRMNITEGEGFQIDMGPTLLMMPEVLHNLFNYTGRTLSDYLDIQRLDPAYEVLFHDGTSLHMRGNPEEMAREIARLSPEDADRFPAMMNGMRGKYLNGRYNFIERQFNSPFSLIRPATLAGLLKALPMESVASYVGRYMKDERLRQAFTFQTLYLGISPYDCPAIYALLPYIEMEFGVWFPRGGMYAIADALYRLFIDMGGQVHFHRPVEKILVEDGRAQGVRLEDGTILRAGVVVCNMDLPSAYQRLLPEGVRRPTRVKRLNGMEHGCSAYLLYLGVRDLQTNWGHHTVVLSESYEETLQEIMHQKRLPSDPAMYVCIPTRTDPSLAPPGHDVVYILTIVPHASSQVDWQGEIPALRERVLNKLERMGLPGLREKIVFERPFSPPDFERTYGCNFGSAFGISPRFFQSAYFRPQSRSAEADGLYFVGASTHPGGGIPMVLTSGRLTAEAIRSDRRLAAL